jgi:hypothetical protein
MLSFIVFFKYWTYEYVLPEARAMRECLVQLNFLKHGIPSYTQYTTTLGIILDGCESKLNFVEKF